MTTSSERWPASPRYARVAQEVIRTCEEIVLGRMTNVGPCALSFRLVPGRGTTCYGIVEHLDSPRLTLVVGRLLVARAPCVPGEEPVVVERVDVNYVPIEGPRVLEVLAQVQRHEPPEAGRACTCGHDLPPEGSPVDLDYQCPACSFWPFRPFGWRGPLPGRGDEERDP